MTLTATPGQMLDSQGDKAEEQMKGASSKVSEWGDSRTDYVHKEPEGELKASQHFSSLLLSGDWLSTIVELSLLVTLTLAALCLPSEIVDVRGSMPLWEVALFFWCTSMVTRVYNSYLEACWFAFPQYRTQPPREHALKSAKDLCGRDGEQLEALVNHDRLSMLSQFFFSLAIYYLVPGYYPPGSAVLDGGLTRLLRLALNHYVMSFGMYWGHRAYHVNPFLWKYLHSVHHWARHPLSRNTYQDHWLENLINHVAGHFSAQLLVPLDHGTFWVSHIFRILESLEKHSGISCYLNLAHQMQRWLPFAQMPHHHDWHHEGHKSCNFTFSSIGGIWDCAFGTRKHGRAEMAPEQMTAQDRKQVAAKGARRPVSIMDDPAVVLLPSFTFMCVVAVRLHSIGFSLAK